MTQKTTTKPTKTAQDEPKDTGEWVEWAKAKIRALEARVASLKDENTRHKNTIRDMDRRILKGKM